MMKLLRHIMNLTKALLVSAFCVVPVVAFDIEYIGLVDDNLRAPTAIAVTDQNVAALEPFDRQLKIYTPDGIMQQEINIEGATSGLVSLNDHLFLFCDRKSHKVMAVDIQEGRNYEYLPDGVGLINPVDIKTDNDIVYILDAGTSGILVFDANTEQIRRIIVQDRESNQITFASSFDYDRIAQQFYILDQVSSKIWVVSSTGTFINHFGSYGAEEGELTRGGSVLYVGDETILVTDRYQGRILAFRTDGEFIGMNDLHDIHDGRLNIPTGMALDKDNLLYVASTESAEIHILKLTTSTSTQAYYTELIFPEDGDVVRPEDVVLKAQVEVIGDPLLVTGFEFELYLGDNLTEPIQTVENPGPGDVSDIENGVIIAAWQPDSVLLSDTAYSWHVRIRTGQTTQPWTEMRKFYTSDLLPDKFILMQNYPNPFNPSTRISFSVPVQSEVKLEVYNILGHKVKSLLNKVMEAGNHEIDWDGTDISGVSVGSGVYFYRLKADKFEDSRKMVLMR